jgi:hypothetical protein
MFSGGGILPWYIWYILYALNNVNHDRMMGGPIVMRWIYSFQLWIVVESLLSKEDPLNSFIAPLYFML